MTSIKSIEAELLDAAPGTTIRILGYISSSGDAEPRDIEGTLITSEHYAEMQRQDLQKLSEADTADLLSETGDLAAADVLLARQQLIDARTNALSLRDSGAGTAHMADYRYLGGSLYRRMSDPDSLYIQRVRVESGLETVKPAKGAVPRAKQQLTVALDLPTRRYVHSVRLMEGKFTSLEVVNKVSAQFGEPIAAT